MSADQQLLPPKDPWFLSALHALHTRTIIVFRAYVLAPIPFPWYRSASGCNKKVFILSVLIAAFVSTCSAVGTAQAQQAVEDGTVELMNPNLRPRTVVYQGNQLLFHIRPGFERAIIFPEPVLLVRSSPTLPGCDIIIDFDVVGFYPTETFERKTIQFVGLTTGMNYTVGIRASSAGLLQPLRLTKQINETEN